MPLIRIKCHHSLHKFDPPDIYFERPIVSHKELGVYPRTCTVCGYHHETPKDKIEEMIFDDKEFKRRCESIDPESPSIFSDLHHNYPFYLDKKEPSKPRVVTVPVLYHNAPSLFERMINVIKRTIGGKRIF
jgi:hypothetical protein